MNFGPKVRDLTQYIKSADFPHSPPQVQTEATGVLTSRLDIPSNDTKLAQRMTQGLDSMQDLRPTKGPLQVLEVPDELNGHIQFIFAADAVADCRHLRTMIDSICPAEAGD